MVTTKRGLLLQVAMLKQFVKKYELSSAEMTILYSDIQDVCAKILQYDIDRQKRIGGK